MIDTTNLSGHLAFDANSLNNLKVAAKANSPESIKEAAKQFEAVFINMVMKSMRAATPQDGLFDNEQSKTFTAMLDQQLSENLATKGVGLAEILTRQLTIASNGPTSAMEQAVSADDGKKTDTMGLNPLIPALLKSSGYAAPTASTSAVAAPAKMPTGLRGHSAAFHQRMSHHAEVASKATGMPANYMLGQAALETGWGRREIKGSDGSNSHNLFGIKATGGWKGKVAETTTTEYINGVKTKQVEKFRAYDSYAESFKDFANLIQNNPRYKSVMENVNSISGYANAMQNSGYATDPNYAHKLASVINKVTA
ncbi:MAG: flagellar assembly peptidoglycan hydrolase FlgJ [Methylophilaceae bacterium]|nr:MAG: flagellar assembly peptidoglycan hydrolase FlgJ [Methylophilaceae bacterium]